METLSQNTHQATGICLAASESTAETTYYIWYSTAICVGVEQVRVGESIKERRLYKKGSCYVQLPSDLPTAELKQRMRVETLMLLAQGLVALADVCGSGWAPYVRKAEEENPCLFVNQQAAAA
jgi:hypothetical protein